MSDDLVPINGRKLRQFRKHVAWTQERLAFEAGISRSYVAEIERGGKRPRPLVAQALADALDVQLDALLIGTAGPRNS